MPKQGQKTEIIDCYCRNGQKNVKKVFKKTEKIDLFVKIDTKWSKNGECTRFRQNGPKMPPKWAEAEKIGTKTGTLSSF